MGDFADCRDDRALGFHFAEHPAVIRGVAENMRFERDYRHRRDAQRFGEICRGDLRPLRHARLVEDQLGRWIVGAQSPQRIDEVFGVAKVGKLRGRGNHDVIRARQRRSGPGIPQMGNIEHHRRRTALRRIDDVGKGIRFEIVSAVERRWRRQQR